MKPALSTLLDSYERRRDWGLLYPAKVHVEAERFAEQVVQPRVDDIAASRDQIAAGGAEIIEERDMGDHGKALTFRDPDGNLVQLFQRAG